MRVVFRVDSSQGIGIGHVMRCLTLADALRKNDVEVGFISRNFHGNIIARIRENGFPVIEPLSEIDSRDSHFDGPEFDHHAIWENEKWRQDAKKAREILCTQRPQLLVVDHYALDARWENSVTPCCDRVMVIDDLANRKHSCELLLDQTLGRGASEYRALVPKRSLLLLGSDFVLLRREFLEWRERSLKRRKNPKLERILLTFGGVDADNRTAEVLSILEHYPFPTAVEVDIVLGETSPHMNSIKDLLRELHLNVRLYTGVENMAEIMSQSDLCIGAAGSTAWERCCLGLPTVMVVVAENQEDIALSLEQKGAALKADAPLESSLPEILESLDTGRLKSISEKAASLVDGKGVDRVAGIIMSL